MTTTSELARTPPSGDLPSARLDAQSRAQLFDLAKHGDVGGDREAARDILHGLIVLDRRDAKAWALLGHVEHELHNLDGACDALTKALALQRKDWDTALELAEVHRELNDADEAQALLTYVTLQAPRLTKEQLDRVKQLGGRS